MNQKPNGTFFAGAALVWRRQSLLWWTFAVNFILAFVAAHGLQRSLGSALDHSRAASAFVHGFDFGWLGLLAQQPAQYFNPQGFGVSSLAFFVFFLFVTPGILEIYCRDEKLPIGLFFESCGTFFWRFVRTCLSFSIALLPIALLAGLLYTRGGSLQDRDISDLPGRILQLAAILGAILFAMIVRLWFDLAEIHIVELNEPKIRRAMGSAWRVLWRNPLRLLWLYFSISIVGWIVFFGGMRLWMFHVGPESVGASFFIGQLLILFWIGTRLWQRASETLWYRGYLALTRSQTPAPEPPLFDSLAAPVPVGAELPPSA